MVGQLFNGVAENLCPYKKVDILKECMHEAARVLRRRLARRHAELPHVRAHYLVRLWRGVRAGQWDRIKGWAHAACFINDFVDIAHQQVRDLHALAEAIRAVHETNIMKDIQELDSDAFHPNRQSRSAARRAGLIRQLEAWRRANRRVALTNIVGESGPCLRGEQVAELLRSH